MTWQCRLLDAPPKLEDGYLDWQKLEVGDMFYIDRPEEALREMHISEYYWANNAAKRKPIAVILPGKHYFCVDQMCYSGTGGYSGGWTVTGDAPKITVHPSINYVGSYHGYLTDGVITDDVEGRSF